MKYNIGNFHWFYADFVMSYDPCVCNYKQMFVVEAFLLQQSEITLKGKLEGKIEDWLTLHPNGSATGQSNNGDVFFGEKEKQIAESVMKQYSSFSSLADQGIKLINSWKTTDVDANGTIENTDLIAMLDLCNGDPNKQAEAQRKYEEALKNGALCRTVAFDYESALETAKTENDQKNFLVQSLKMIPYLGGAVALFDGIIFGGNSNSSKPARPLAISASITLDGTINYSQTAEIGKFYVPGSKMDHPLNLLYSGYPLYNRPLGVFNLLRKPIIEFWSEVNNIQDPVYSSSSCNPERGDHLTRFGFGEMFRFKLRNIDYVVNPYAGFKTQMDNNHEDIEIYASFSIENKNIGFYGNHTFNTRSINYIETPLMPLQTLMNMPLQVYAESFGYYCFSNIISDFGNISSNEMIAFNAFRMKPSGNPNIFLKLVVLLKRADGLGNPVLFVQKFPVEKVAAVDGHMWNCNVLTGSISNQDLDLENLIPANVRTNGNVNMSYITTPEPRKVYSGKQILIKNKPTSTPPADNSTRISGEVTLSVQNLYDLNLPPIPPVSQSDLNTFCNPGNTYEIKHQNSKRESTNEQLDVVDHQLISISPNPVNSTATISAYIPGSQIINIYIADVFGNKTCTLVDNETQSGLFTKSFNTSDWNAGVYFVTMSSVSGQVTKKMIVFH